MRNAEHDIRAKRIQARTFRQLRPSVISGRRTFARRPLTEWTRARTDDVAEIQSASTLPLQGPSGGGYASYDAEARGR
jgi:hypothetical protein